MMKKNKVLIIILIVMLIATIIIWGIVFKRREDLATLKDTKGDVVVKVKDDTITYIEGYSISNKDIKKAENKDGAMKKEVEVEASSDKKISMRLNLKKVEETYRNDNMKWEIYNDDGELVNSGTFNGVIHNSDITMLDAAEIKKGKSKYSIYIWSVSDEVNLKEDLYIDIISSIA